MRKPHFFSFFTLLLHIYAQCKIAIDIFSLFLYNKTKYPER